MFTLCPYAAIRLPMLPLNVYYAALNLLCYYAAINYKVYCAVIMLLF